MHRARLAALILALFVLPATADEFVAGTEDVPLMPGLVTVAGKSLAFDKPEGRIVEAEARGPVTRAKAHDFYDMTLPQLGWSADGTDRWQREGEVLRIDYKGKDGNLAVGFTLSPQQEPRP
jgi:hypothetical protein